MLTKHDLEHLAELARIELKEGEEQKLQKDLGAILDYFKELQTLDTEGVEPMAGGTELKSIMREDELASSAMPTGRQVMRPAGGEARQGWQESGIEEDTGKGPEQFPDKQDGYLKVPPVF